MLNISKCLNPVATCLGTSIFKTPCIFIALIFSPTIIKLWFQCLPSDKPLQNQLTLHNPPQSASHISCWQAISWDFFLLSLWLQCFKICYKTKLKRYKSTYYNISSIINTLSKSVLFTHIYLQSP